MAQGAAVQRLLPQGREDRPAGRPLLLGDARQPAAHLLGHVENAAGTRRVAQKGDRDRIGGADDAAQHLLFPGIEI